MLGKSGPGNEFTLQSTHLWHQRDVVADETPPRLCAHSPRPQADRCSRPPQARARRRRARTHRTYDGRGFASLMYPGSGLRLFEDFAEIFRKQNAGQHGIDGGFFNPLNIVPVAWIEHAQDRRWKRGGIESRQPIPGVSVTVPGTMGSEQHTERVGRERAKRAIAGLGRDRDGDLRIADAADRKSRRRIAVQ